eukprot:gnl/MRDRNA2_/MRDRNA2_96138_c0_seq1.p1 gnl/MRDRNA2_/MRDRNA2_96138_c0~~gnl/MRDRNA2_/MRDRNA2_96138_c0_seq1.p1  ORF type:complete len:190 (-),score=25.60 gnl/MRDRNA2_/MRDRNA2_96138_c0_seq1:118-606(-)
MALLRSARRLALARTAPLHKHCITQGDNTYLGCWKAIPQELPNGALTPVSYEDREHGFGVPSDWVLRGTGLHGPENTHVMKLALWNRLKQKRPQREVPSLWELQDYYKLELAITWFTFGLMFIMAPMHWWCKKYRIVNESFPWMPPRTDGSRGPGTYCWFIE